MEYRVAVLLIVTLVLIQKSYGWNEKYIENLNRNAGSLDCFDAYKDCRKTPECKEALKQLHRKCKFRGFKCNNESNIKECVGIRDQLFMYGFEEKRCRCVDKLGECFKLLDKIYANPCFRQTVKSSNVRGAGNHHTLPRQEISKTSTTTEKTNGIPATSESSHLDSLKVNESVMLSKEDTEMKAELGSAISTTTTPSSKQNHKTRHHEHNHPKEIATPAPAEESIFGDEGFAKPPPSRRNSRRKTSRGQLQNRNGDERIPPTKEKIRSTTIVMDESIIEDARNKESKAPLNKPLQFLSEKREWEMTTDMKYRLISICIGSVFVVIILLTMLYFAWIRISKLQFRYKPGKAVIKNNESAA